MADDIQADSTQSHDDDDRLASTEPTEPGEPVERHAPMQSFGYAAQMPDCTVMRGSVEAVSVEAARKELEHLGFTVIEFDAAPKPAKGKPFRGDDFVAFNQQLAQMTEAGLPVERGLRLIAQDMGNNRLSATVRDIADDLDRGVSLKDAFEKHRGRFPSMYGSLMEVGVRSGNLPGMLLNLGRHLEMISRLRAALWRAASYPMLLLLALSGLVIFLGIAVLPGFVVIFEDFDTQLPVLTELVIDAGNWAPLLACGVILIVFAIPLTGYYLRVTGKDQAFADRFLIPMPIIGPVLRFNRSARWCDALQMAVSAGLDLPRAIHLAGEAVGSPTMRRDGQLLSDWIERGGDLQGFVPPRSIPTTIIAAIELSPNHRDLPHALATITNLYEEQADIRVSSVQLMTAPVLMAGMAVLMGVVVMALFLPLVKLIQSVSY